jgi:cytochrome b561
MALMNSETGWGWPARVLHWAIALLIAGMSALGLYMDPKLAAGLDPLHFALIQDHKSWGAVVLALVSLRILWRVANRRHPALPDGTPGWQRHAVAVTHVALYALMIAVPVSGWLMVTASPFNDPGYMQIRNMVFGLFEMPDPFPKGDHELAAWLQAIHGTLWMALMAVLAAHVAGALWHHFVQRDRVLARMIRGR